MSRRPSIQPVMNCAIYQAFVHRRIHAVVPDIAPCCQICWMKCWITEPFRPRAKAPTSTPHPSRRMLEASACSGGGVLRSIVSKDSDFRQLAFLYGPPPKVVWLQVANASTTEPESLARSRPGRPT
ncbi:MAG: DUF5615 family PIN-like protein [Acidimicrobiia bacterium]